MAETAEPINRKTCVLKASIHCEGCKRKVKKILTKLHGVEFVEVDTKLQKVTVIGTVDADTLINKLVKSGKHAQLWPQKREKQHKISQTHTEIAEQPNTNSINATKEPQPPVNVQSEANYKKCEGSGVAAAKVDGGAATSNEDSCGGGGGGVEVIKDASVKTSDVQETKSEEEKKTEATEVEPPQAAKKTNGGGGSGGDGESGTVGKKKKKKGQKGNFNANGPQSSAAPPCTESENPPLPLPINHGTPRHHHAPPLPTPVYGVSYNTAYPTSSYTESYYAAPPPYSYAHAYQGPETQPPPLDHHDSYPRQPLDSFEMFSDENPNGCSIA